jgi:hypothetical protein
MNSRLFSRALVFAFAGLATICSSSTGASAQEASTFGKCGFSSMPVVRNIIIARVRADLTAKNLRPGTVQVLMPMKNVRTVVKQSNVTGLTGITLKADKTGYTINTSGPLSVPCQMTVPVTIKGSYTEAGSSVRKTFTSTQDITVTGSFN